LGLNRAETDLDEINIENTNLTRLHLREVTFIPVELAKPLDCREISEISKVDAKGD
jgi:hypothetical protein